ncbi:MAG TPA: pantetheine-phosphate adenylyltransferase [Acidimicrobiaceae bacterium]|nr:pantetheine-phosphate adenylyltransferase [Acidimicrobiaceae bacterium]HCB37649.1 pantetheine-phosphate adenylyltransferase [Acidimicrobiaceae bacterium]
MTTVLYPGSFDPVHNGHVDVIAKATRMFDAVVVAVMTNPAKASTMFTGEERVEMVVESVAHLANVSVVAADALVVAVAESVGADVIVKGLRSVGDFEIEMRMAHTNHSVSGIETVFVPCRHDEGFIASNFVREIAARGGDCSHLVPAPVADRLRRLDGAQ